MNGPGNSDPLLETLRLAQRLGFFGAAPIEDAVTHAHSFVEALGDVAPGTRIADIGSGGGLPGLVLAWALPQASITLVDRRQKRTDFLERAVRRLGLGHVTVRCEDVEDVVRGVATGAIPPFEVVTARGFGPPDLTLTLAVGLLGARPGTIVVSEPPDRDRWDPVLLDRLGVSSSRIGAVRRFDRPATP